jgi:exonuclease III
MSTRPTNEIDLAHPKTNQKTTGFLPEERVWLDHSEVFPECQLLQYWQDNESIEFSCQDAYLPLIIK